MKKQYKRTTTFNFLKGLAAIAFSSLIGNVLYFFVFRGTNAEDPEGAAMRTSIFSILIFVFSVYAFIKTLPVTSKNENVIDEKQALKDALKEANYELDYNSYFKKLVKTRLWGYYLAAAVWQIPLLINYVIVATAPEGTTIYELPIWIYEWNLSSLFAYELLGALWFLGIFLYMAVFISVFTYFAYRYYKQFAVKPSYISAQN